MKSPGKTKAGQSRTPATTRKRPVKDLAARKTASGGATASGSQVAMGDGSVRFVR